ncbi:hypothetical protein CCHL11_08692 [Colletotrichum chlorophyti]|uniref:Uncharacterized protein n=1 Tax=Colletotrichum chlorophyti TaxID=708187 RepID=A0A1Q8RCE7_9PEZI|nr:hypothetical protein CCHL11_08692 [Colletotrichum chlorophyti]
MSDDPDFSDSPGGASHETFTPLDSTLQSELYDALEALYATDVSDIPLPRDALKPDPESHSVTAKRHAAGTPLDAACAQLSDCLKAWRVKIQLRYLRRQTAIYHLHPPENSDDFESRVRGHSMSAADSELIANLRSMCPKLGFEVFPVVLTYTGTTCQYEVPVPSQPNNDHNRPDQAAQTICWKRYQYVKHSPVIQDFRAFTGTTLAKMGACHRSNVLDERNVAWERARRGIFFWQHHRERQDFEEERRAREEYPRWQQHIIPGTISDLGSYEAPAIIIVPLSTQLEFVDLAERPPHPADIWHYLLGQCDESSHPYFYFAALKALCYYVWPEPGNAPQETHILAMKVRDRQDWVHAVDPGLMGNLILTSLTFKDHQLCKHLIEHSHIEPKIDYAWLCAKQSVYCYDAADVLKGLGRFLFQSHEFLQIANAINKLPVCSVTGTASGVIGEFVESALTTYLKLPVSANHGWVVASFLKFFPEFDTWCHLVNSIVSRGLRNHIQFMLGMLNGMLGAARRCSVPLEKVKTFYEKQTKLLGTPSWQISDLISNRTRDQSDEAQTARQAWCVKTPSEALRDETTLLPMSHAVIAGLFRNLDRLGMHDEVATLADHIVTCLPKMEPIHMAGLWLPTLRVLHDLVDPRNPAYRRMFQGIFERYEEAVFENLSGQTEESPGIISPMNTCCEHCKMLESFFEQPKWKSMPLIKTRAAVEHIQQQLLEQDKPIRTDVSGKNERALILQLTKASLDNERLRKAGELRRQEASRVVRQFNPDELLPFLGTKMTIARKLANAETQKPSAQETPARASASPLAITLGFSRTSSPYSATPRRDVPELMAKRESTPRTDPFDRHAATVASSSKGLGITKAEPYSVSPPAKKSDDGFKDIRDIFASVKKEETVASSSQGPVKSSSTSMRDRLKNLGHVKLESAPKYDNYSQSSTDRLRAAVDKKRHRNATPRSSSSGASTLLSRRDPLGSFTGVRSKDSMPSLVEKDGVSRLSAAPTPPSASSSGHKVRANAHHSSTTQLPTRTGSFSRRSPRLDIFPDPSVSLPGLDKSTTRSGSHSSACASGEPDYTAAILDAERARKKRPAGSTWGVRTASGSVAGSGTASAPGKSRFGDLARDKMTPRLSDSARQSGSSNDRAGSRGPLSTRSPNKGSVSRHHASSTTAKRKVDDSHDLIDLCSNSPSRGSSKRQKRTAVFDPLDDDPFAD